MTHKLQHLKNHWFLLGLIVLVSSFLYLHNLSTAYITLWDEAIHANVVKNLANNCCVPALHNQDYGTDFRDWSNNYIWLHKPLLPFYIDAGFYKLFGKTLFAMRLPNVVFAEFTIVLLFLIGKKYFNPRVGLIAAGVFACNGFVFALVQGRQFSELCDLSYIFFLVGSLYMLLGINQKLTVSTEQADSLPGTQTPRVLLSYIFFGVWVGIAYLCKSGLALVPFGVLGLVLLKGKRWDQLLNFLYAGLVLTLFVAPYNLMLAHLAPAEFSFEQSAQLAHLTSAVEYWGRPWDYYFSFYSIDIFGVILLGMSYVSIGFGIVKSHVDNKIFIITTLALLYIIPLSFGVSKISNFIIPVLPATCLLIGYMATNLLKTQKYFLLSAFGLSLLLTWFLFHGYQEPDNSTTLQRFTPLLFELGILFGFGLILFLVRKIITKKACSAVMVIVVVIVSVSSLHSNWKQSVFQPSDYPGQKDAVTTATQLHDQLKPTDLLLVQSAALDHAYLYIQYWSGIQSFPITDKQPIQYLSWLLPKNRHIYALSNTTLPHYKQIKKLPLGALYEIR